MDSIFNSICLNKWLGKTYFSSFLYYYSIFSYIVECPSRECHVNILTHSNDWPYLTPFHTYQTPLLFKEESVPLYKYSNIFLFKLYFSLSYWLKRWSANHTSQSPSPPHHKLWTIIKNSKFVLSEHHLIPEQNIDVVCDNRLLILAISMI